MGEISSRDKSDVHFLWPLSMCSEVGRLVLLRRVGRLSISGPSSTPTDTDDDEEDIVGVERGVENVSLSGESCAGAKELLRAFRVVEFSGISLDMMVGLVH